MTKETSLLTRTLRIGSYGKDVDGVKRSVYRGLDMHDGGQRLKVYVTKSQTVKRTFGPFFGSDLNKLRHLSGFDRAGVVGQPFWAYMVKKGYPDPYALSLMQQYIDDTKAPPVPKLVYPHDKDFHSSHGGLHETGGIGGNWAIDFMAAPGTPVIAPEGGIVTRTAGYNPNTGLHGSHRDVFGWSIYLRTLTGFYYSTHYGSIVVNAGTLLKTGQLLGYVGDWPYDRGRSHTHLGFTNVAHIKSLSVAKIYAVAAAPRIDVQRR